jgi:homocysteine S-methyltransferase
MAKYRDALPQLNGDWFPTGGGIETTLVFDKGFDLPEFASFPLLGDEAVRQMLRDCCGTDHRHVDAIFRACRSR